MSHPIPGSRTASVRRIPNVLAFLAVLGGCWTACAETAYSYAYPQYTVEIAAGASNTLRQVASIAKVPSAGAAREEIGYRRVYATGTGTAAKPADLSIVDPKRPTRISNHVMQAIQATVSF